MTDQTSTQYCPRCEGIGLLEQSADDCPDCNGVGVIEQMPSTETDLLELAWGVIANAHGGNWSEATPEWRYAAERWRDAWHRHLDKQTPITPQPGAPTMNLVIAEVDSIWGTIRRWRRPFYGIPFSAIPTVVRLRLTVCRHLGHTGDDYCYNCGAPWFCTRNGSSVEEER